MSKPTPEDVAHDAHDAEVGELHLLSEESERKFMELFGPKAARTLTSYDRLDYVDWLIKHLDEAEALNKSASRLTICLALFGMPNYETNDERDGPLGLPTGTDMLQAIMPPATDDTWGYRGRPQSFFHQILRMGGKVTHGKAKGKPIHLIKTLLGPEGQLKMGRVVTGWKLDATGVVYAHIHSQGKITKDAMFEYWEHVERGVDGPEPTNPAYLALTGMGPEVDESPNHWQTPGAYAWGSLDSLERWDDTIHERYKDVSAQKLSSILVSVYTKDVVECFKFLKASDRSLLVEDVMVHAQVGASKYARSAIQRDMDAKKAYAAKIQVLADLYGAEQQSGPDPTTVIEELICRSAWAVVTRVMGYRVGHKVQVVDVATELMSHARTLEQLEALQQLTGDMKATLPVGEPVVDEEPF